MEVVMVVVMMAVVVGGDALDCGSGNAVGGDDNEAAAYGGRK